MNINSSTSSFYDFLANQKALPDFSKAVDRERVIHGTTIVAVGFTGGVVMAGDRRATMGNFVAQNDIQKVFAADDYSAIGIAGSAGIAVELVKLFQVELEHYEKIEGMPLSVEGKANRLSVLLRGNLGLALEGLAALPLYAAYDKQRDAGRVFSYDITGGRYEEHDYYAVGSGSLFARASLKKMFEPSDSQDFAIRIALESIYDAAEEDSATAGPDMARNIYPVVVKVDRSGFERISEENLSIILNDILTGRKNRPDGPIARQK
jgi:proteasome beta subunit